MKKIGIIIVLTLLAAVFAMAHEGEDHKNKGAEKMELNGGSRGKVPFPHLTHQKTLVDCMICHSHFDHKAGEIDRLKKEGQLEKKQIMNTWGRL